MATSAVTTLFEWDTIQSADSTEWCPLAPFQTIFVCATYQIEKGENEGSDASAPPTSRHGRIYVFEISLSSKLEPHQVLELPAVLDMKWAQSHICGKIILGVVTATAKLLIFELKEDKTLEQISEADVQGNGTSSKEVLALSLDWSCAKPSIDKSEVKEASVVVSDSHGGANVFHLSDKFELMLLKRWQGHEYEAWIAAFNYWEPSLVFSGGDDCTMKGWDIRTRLDTPTFVNRSHDAGVTSIHSNPFIENILVSGSYDEFLRIWDLRKMKSPLYTCKMSGGVWRVKWNPFTFDSILTACMHGGFHVVDCKNALKGTGEPNLLASYNNHDSIAYGADWSHLDGEFIKTIFTKLKLVETGHLLLPALGLGLIEQVQIYF